MRTIVAAGAGLISVAALAAAMLTLAPFDAAALEGDTAIPASDTGTPASDSAGVLAATPRREPPPHPGEVLTDVLDELVEDAIITAEQAEVIAERIREQSQEVHDQLQKRRRARRVSTRLFEDVRLIIIEATGLTREDFAAQWRSGATVGEVAAGAGVTRTDLTRALLVAAEDRIDSLLDADRITDDQAERLSDGVQDRTSAIVDRIWDRSRNDDRAVPHDDA